MGSCEPINDPPIHQIMYEFTLNCVAIEENCVPAAEAFDCIDGVDRIILDENFEDPAEGQANNWIRNWDGETTGQTPELTTFLGPLGKGKIEVVRTLVVPNSAESLLFEFDLYEIDKWEIYDKVYFRVNSFYLKIQSFSMSTNEKAKSGYFFKSQPEENWIPFAI